MFATLCRRLSGAVLAAISATPSFLLALELQSPVPVTQGIMDQISWVEAADLDGDGNTDLVVSHISSLGGSVNGSDLAYVAWYRNRGNGTFDHAVTIGGGIGIDEANNVRVIDLNGDGHLDVLVCGKVRTEIFPRMSYPFVAWFENAGDGAFLPEPHWVLNNENLPKGGRDYSRASIYAIAAGDLNTNGLPDIAFSFFETGLTAWSANVGDGTFAPPAYLPESSTLANNRLNETVFIADATGDGINDLLVGSMWNPVVSKLVPGFYPMQAGGGGFGDLVLGDNGSTDVYPRIYPADITGDGRIEMIVASMRSDQSRGEISWYPTPGMNPKHSIVRSLSGVGAVSAADLDGDSLLDIIGTSQRESRIFWHKNQGDGSFQDAINITNSLVGASGVLTADLDHDQIEEIIGWSYRLPHRLTPPHLSIFKQTDPQSLTYTEESIVNRLTVTPQGTAIADIDHDGDNDFITTGSYDGRIAWVETNADGSFGHMHVIAEGVGAPSHVVPSDVDGDGAVDVLSIGSRQSVAGGGLFLHRNQGNGVFESALNIDPEGGDYVTFAVADTDGDERLDIALVKDNHLLLFRGNSSGRFEPGRFIADFVVRSWETTSLTFADCDSDGNPELFYATSSEMGFFKNLGNGEFAKRQGFEGLASGKSIAVEDVDGDGHLDVVTIRFGPTIHYGSGQGMFMSDMLPDYNEEHWFNVADLDDDGDLDMLLARKDWPGSGTILSWVEQTSPRQFESPQELGRADRDPSYVQVSDRDGDGDNDVFLSVDTSILYFENPLYTVPTNINEFTRWIQEFDLEDLDAQLLADPDSDGIQNWLEFALDGEPGIYDYENLSGILSFAESGEELSFKRRTTDELSYTVEIGYPEPNDLRWEPFEVNGTTTEMDGWETVHFSRPTIPEVALLRLRIVYDEADNP